MYFIQYIFDITIFMISIKDTTRVYILKLELLIYLSTVFDIEKRERERIIIVNFIVIIICINLTPQYFTK
jgi:hypothetical protein